MLPPPPVLLPPPVSAPPDRVAVPVDEARGAGGASRRTFGSGAVTSRGVARTPCSPEAPSSGTGVASTGGGVGCSAGTSNATALNVSSTISGRIPGAKARARNSTASTWSSATATAMSALRKRGERLMAGMEFQRAGAPVRSLSSYPIDLRMNT